MTKHTAARQHSLKLAFISAIALGAAALSGSASAAVGNGTATGTVVAPIAITKMVDLSFGRFLAGATSGTVVVNTAGTRSVTGGVVAATGGTVSAAKFDITGAANAGYSIAYSAAVVLSSGTDTMALTQVSDLAGNGSGTGELATGTLSAAGAQSLYIGGSLAVAINQAPGNYSAAITATVNYN